MGNRHACFLITPKPWKGEWKGEKRMKKALCASLRPAILSHGFVIAAAAAAAVPVKLHGI